MKKTFKELLEIDLVVGKLYRKDTTLKDSKFGYAYNRFHAKNYEPVIKNLKEDMADLGVKHALEDEKTKALLQDEQGNYKYSKEGKLALNKEERELIESYENKEIEITPYISVFTPSMSDEDFETLKGIVVDGSVQPQEADTDVLEAK